jgi:hypothetical protein
MRSAHRSYFAIPTGMHFPKIVNRRIFSLRGAGCTLATMCNRSGNWVIAALLMFQLVIGMQWQVAHADMAASERQSSGVDAGHCPGHASKDSRTDERGSAGASTSVPSSHATSTPVHKHDCCGSNDCQCHCAQGPAVLNLSPASAVCSALLLLPVFDARPPVARTNELFRPPIA